MSNRNDHSFPLLPVDNVHAAGSSSAPLTRVHSRHKSGSSRPGSSLGLRGKSPEQTSDSKLRFSEDIERHGQFGTNGSGARASRASLDNGVGVGVGGASGCSTPRRSTPLSGRRSLDAGRTLFKAPDDDEIEYVSSSMPLLAGDRESGTSVTTSRQEEELFAAEGPNSAMKGTLLDGIANMANSILGAGIIGLPYAISRAGFVMGVVLLISLAAVTDWTLRLVVINAKLSGRESYTDTIHHCFGNIGAMGVSFFQFAFAFGGMCAFSVIIGDSLPHVIAYVFPFLADHAFLRLFIDRRVIIVLVTIIVSFPLSLHRDIVKLSKSSTFALISMGVIVTTVVLRGPTVDASLRGPPLHAISLIRPGIFEAIGVISFAFVCHHNTIFIYKSLDTPTLDRFYAVTHVSTALSLVCCLLMAVSGYLVFTSKTEGNILNNFPADDLMVNIARFCFGANMSTTVPLENYVCREVIEETFFKDKPFSQKRHLIVTSLIVFTSMLISLTTCDLGVVLEIAGGLSATALAFIFPASAYFMLTRGPWYSRQRLPAVACTAFGVIVLVLSCGLTISKAWKNEGGTKVCT